MLPTQAPQAGIYTALGSTPLVSWFLSALCPAISRGTRLFWIDAGNGFDAYGLSRAARTLGLDSRPILHRISLARPFNAFQLETIVRDKVPASWRGEPIILSDLLAPLYDEDLPLADAKKAAAGVLEGLQRLPAIWLVLAVVRRVPEGREEILKNLIRLSKNLALLAPVQDSLTLRAVDRDTLDFSGGMPAGRMR